jgi:hypothetical protein
MRLPWLAVACALTAALPLPRTAAAQPTSVQDNGADFAPPPPARGKDIVIITPGARPRNNILTIAGLAGAGALFGGLGLYFHLDSRSASNDVAATKPTNEPWTSADAARYDQAHSSATKAAVFYGVGGAFALGALVYAVVTQPEPETTIIHPHSNPTAMPTVAPTPGGALVGGAWRF